MSKSTAQDLATEMGTLYETLQETRERLTDLKRKSAKGKVENYILSGPGDERVPLSALFGEKDDLVVIQNMGRSCPYCALWADGFAGVQEHIENRAALVLVSPDPPEEHQKFGAARGWRFQILSSQGSAFKKDLGFESESGEQMPGVSTFHRDGDEIVNVANDYFGPGDDYCAVWHLWGLLPKGVDDWKPQFTY